MTVQRVPIVIFGGGAAGLWLLDRLRSRGDHALLLETSALGAGQTIVSQGILHSGLKYSLDGILSAAAREARDMPNRWRRCFTGQDEPNLQDTEVLAQSFYLWGSATAASRLGILAARHGLQVTPRETPPAERPAFLRRCPSVLEVEEQVISPASLLANLATRNPDAMLHIDPKNGVEFASLASGGYRLHLQAVDGRRTTLDADRIVLTAGNGNAELRRRLGLRTDVMQRRPLHMAMVRGDLPEFNGHCVDGARTRVSITSARDVAGNIVWQIGGQTAEDGVAMNAASLIAHVQRELSCVLPDVSLRNTEWSTYRVERAEGVTVSGGRPNSFRLLQEGNVFTAWPTKLVLVPQLADAIQKLLPHRGGSSARLTTDLSDWPRPSVALPPWEIAREWTRFVASSRVAA